MRLPNRADDRRFRFSIWCQAAILACVIYASGCTVGPKYHRPDAPSVTTWELAEPWREGAPKDSIPKGQWWTVFRDNDLDALETQAIAANQTIRISLARVEQARANAAIQVSTVFPRLSTEIGRAHV